MAAECLHESLKEAGCIGNIQLITQKTTLAQHDFLFLLFPIHSFNAPEAVYKWIDALDVVEGIPAAVIAVSGGGEIVPNRAGSLSSIKRLEKKGYVVNYDCTVVMPSNIIVGTHELLAVKLLEVLPSKVGKIVDDVLCGVRQRTTPPLIDRIVSTLGEAEKRYTGSFGKAIQVSSDCDGCGWCGLHCPAGNITVIEGKVHFENKCHLCLNCLYGCPRKALAAGKWKFVIVKEGYDLNEFKERIPLTDPIDLNELAKGYLWKGVRKYLENS